ncbi:MAG: polysaccharide deacetylase family protein [Thermoplasmata archaeon]|nr:polysaccharide deacetylase family protein [Thermoplasmata archaeon]
MKRYLLFTVDMEEMDRLSSLRISKRGWERIETLLEEFGIHSTLFTTGVFAENYPDTVREAWEKGHEIASHGMNHSEHIEEMNVNEVLKVLHKAKATVEKSGCDSPIGFRAPRLMPPSPSVLLQAGFLYDSSLHPTWVPGRYNNLKSRTDVHVIYDRKMGECGKGLIEVPISVSPRLRLPVSWIWFRNYPNFILQSLLKKVIENTGFLHIYFHPWEFVELNGYSTLPYLYRRRTGPKLIERLRTILEYLVRREGVKAVTITEYLRIRGLLLEG